MNKHDKNLSVLDVGCNEKAKELELHKSIIQDPTKNWIVYTKWAVTINRPSLKHLKEETF